MLLREFNETIRFTTLKIIKIKIICIKNFNQILRSFFTLLSVYYKIQYKTIVLEVIKLNYYNSFSIIIYGSKVCQKIDDPLKISLENHKLNLIIQFIPTLYSK